MKRRTKWILGAGVILLVGGGAAARLGNKDRDLPRVTTGKVAKKDLVSRVTCNGKVQARKKVELSAPIAGQIINLAVREGDSLKKGDFLMQIDRVTLQANADSSKAALAALLSDRDAAKANLERDRLEYERASTSYRGGVIAELDFQRAKAAYDASQANLQSVENRIEQARATFAGARDTLSKTTIMAPIAGLITRLNVEEGEVAIIGTMNNPGTVLMTISDLSVIEAVMDVDETDIPQVIVGQKATLLIDAYPGKAFDGVVTEVGSSPVNAAAGSTAGIDFEVKIRIENPPAGLKPGLSVTADIATGHRDGVVAVPLQALVLRDRDNPEPAPVTEEAEKAGSAKKMRATAVESRSRDQEGVFVLQGGVAKFSPVKTGLTGDLDIEAASGVKEGQEIVTGPFRILRALKDGDRVVVAKPEAKKKA
ncbi:MAG TPA: efflux RND transporter periplasmic adaptor subunit [Verrucomicrobiae bacterium]|nr:efflux RND transporter periplasmic adaptor subunit [Verrucomicrobiae bacterium]